MLPQIESYGKYSGDNYGVHTLRIIIGSLSVWYSYKTPIAFRHPDTGLVIRENDWGPTTGKHMGWIDGGRKSSRIPGRDFERRFKEIMLVVTGTTKPKKRKRMDIRFLRMVREESQSA